MESDSREGVNISKEEASAPAEHVGSAAEAKGGVRSLGQESPPNLSQSAKKRKRKRKKRGSKNVDEEVQDEKAREESTEEITKMIETLKVSVPETSPQTEKLQNKGTNRRIVSRTQTENNELTVLTPSKDSIPADGMDAKESNTEGQSSSKHKHKRNRKKKNAAESVDDARDGEWMQQGVVVSSMTENQTPRQEKLTPRLTNRPRSARTSLSKPSPHRRRQYEKYWPVEKVSAGLKRGELLKGPLRINKKNFELAWVSVPGIRRDVLLEGMCARNRALEGDIVALEILPRSKWKIMKSEYEAHKEKLNRDVTGGSSISKEEATADSGAKNQKDLQLTPSKSNSSQGEKHCNTPSTPNKHNVPDEFLQQTADVVYIIEKKHTRAASGHLKPFNQKHSNHRNDPDGLFSPTDTRLPRIRIPCGLCPAGFFDRPQDFANTLFVACITEWPENSSLDNYFAIGKIARSLGEAGEIDPETEGIFFEYGIDSGPFPDEALACLPKQTPWTIPEQELTSRRDFRDECVFTIDPLTARDLDDALSCKRLPDGNVEVGVHIADVSYFVRQGTVLDDVAQDRATSTYMVQTVVPMLPRRLCEELCSLNPGEDRMTFSIVWVMTDKGEILSDWKGRGIIRSRVKMAYEHAQEMIQKPKKKWEPGELPTISDGTDIAEISLRVNLLHKIALHLRRNRIENGALRLDQVKLQFDLDKETGMPLGYHVHQQRDSNKLIEEFMLLANMTVAHHICTAYPNMALLRRHPKPHQKQLDDLLELCKTLGIKFNASSPKGIQVSLGQFPMGSAEHEILVQLTMRPMKNAEYFCAGSLEEELYSHYALSVPLYTHFTSPIRRYADVIVHRLLAASLELDNPVDKDAVDVDMIARHCNDRKLAAKRAGELSNELFFAIFVRECGPLEEEGVVLAVMDQSLDVFVPALGVTKRIYCKFCPGVKRYEVRSKQEHKQPELKLVWGVGTNTRADVIQTLHIFTKVRVILTTESQTEEKSKHCKVYAILQSPKSSNDLTGKQEGPPSQPVKSGHLKLSPDESVVSDNVVRKKLFESEEETASKNQSKNIQSKEDDDGVTVETESAESSGSEAGGVSAKCEEELKVNDSGNQGMAGKGDTKEVKSMNEKGNEQAEKKAATASDQDGDVIIETESAENTADELSDDVIVETEEKSN